VLAISPPLHAALQTPLLTQSEYEHSGGAVSVGSAVLVTEAVFELLAVCELDMVTEALPDAVRVRVA